MNFRNGDPNLQIKSLLEENQKLKQEIEVLKKQKEGSSLEVNKLVDFGENCPYCGSSFRQEQGFFGVKRKPVIENKRVVHFKVKCYHCRLVYFEKLANS